MVSEGVDIPRLRVVIYLTNRLTLLSFRQIVGRVVRTDPANVGDHGRVYLPADPRLLEMAHQVTEAVHLLPPPIVLVTDGTGATRVMIEGEDGERVPFETLETFGEQDHRILSIGVLFEQRHRQGRVPERDGRERQR